MEQNKEVIFKNDKHLIFVRNLGKGGTGEVKLFYDSEIDKYFAIKKFVPPDEYRNEYYSRFVNEIKILVDAFHPNIVRCYTYYLYPEYKAGYLQMEYIQGETIDEFLQRCPELFDKMFLSAVNAFEYLEGMSILHRDIRPQNFLVCENSELKVIDFGFGKETNAETLTSECIHLNWPVTVNPEEIDKNIGYDFATEVYFLGSMFRRLLKNNKSIYSTIIDKMCIYQKQDRYQSFCEIKTDLADIIYSLDNFTEEQKNIYSDFVNSLMSCLVETYNKISFPNDDEIIEKLKQNVDSNILEKYISNNSKLLSCFIKGTFAYKKERVISFESLNRFYKWIVKESPERNAIIFQNIKNRIEDIPNSFKLPDDDLPF